MPHGRRAVLTLAAAVGFLAVAGTVVWFFLLPSSEKPFLVLKDQSGPVYALAFSADGRILASGGWDGIIRLRDVTTWRLTKSFDGKGQIGDLSFSPDGRFLATNQQVWDMSTARTVNTSRGEPYPFPPVAFSPIGSVLACSSQYETIDLSDAVTGRFLRSLDGRIRKVRSLEFSKDGQMIGAGAENGTIRIWDVATGHLLGEIAAHDSLTSVAFSPDRHVIASGGYDGIKLFDSATGNLLRKIRPGILIYSLAFSPDGKILATGSKEDVTLWNPKSGRLMQTLRQSSLSKSIFTVVFSPDGRILAACDNDGEIEVWGIPGSN